jgi:hypothetical protein
MGAGGGNPGCAREGRNAKKRKEVEKRREGNVRARQGRRGKARTGCVRHEGDETARERIPDIRPVLPLKR